MAMKDEVQKNRLVTPIFVFDDYIDYLKAWYGYAKRFGVTQTVFIQRAGVGTQAYFSDILARRKKLALQHIDGFIKALELTAEAAEFFTLLVQKEHARKGAEKEQVLKRLAIFREKNSAALVTGGNSEYYGSWRYPLLREYIVSKGSVASLREIKRAMLHLTMPLEEIRRTVNKLIQWNMVVQDEQTGELRPGPGGGTITYSEMPHAVVNDVKRLFIESSLHAMETLPHDKRHISMAIGGMSRERYELFCRKIDELRREFLADGAPGEAQDNVYGLNVQLFPLMSTTSDVREQRGNEADDDSSEVV